MNSYRNTLDHIFCIRVFIHAYHSLSFLPSGPFSNFKVHQKETQINIVIVDWMKCFFVIKTSISLKTEYVSCFVHETEKNVYHLLFVPKLKSAQQACLCLSSTCHFLPFLQLIHLYQRKWFIPFLLSLM